jgi:hypothetical protein
MESKDIIKNIQAIYDKYRVPPNVQDHQRRAASVASLIIRDWKGPSLEMEDIVACLLLHDMGNILKFRFDEIGVEMLGKEAPRAEYWKQVKEEFVEKYGTSVSGATRKILQEIGCNQIVIKLSQEMDFSNKGNIVNTDKWAGKICGYSDYRTGPFGIVTIEGRWEDLNKRYPAEAFGGMEKRKELITQDFQMEKEIFQHLSIKPEDVNDATIKEYFKSF